MKLIDFFKKYPLTVLVFVLLIPLVISILMYLPWLSISKGSVEGWLGFWGSYLGGTIGTLGVVTTTYFLIEANKQATKDAANLQDRQIREREYITFLLKKNEEIFHDIILINELVVKQIYLYRKIVNESRYHFWKMVDSKLIDEEEESSNLLNTKLNLILTKSLYIKDLEDDVESFVEVVQGFLEENISKLKNDDFDILDNINSFDNDFSTKATELSNTVKKKVLDQVSLLKKPIENLD